MTTVSSTTPVSTQLQTRAVLRNVDRLDLTRHGCFLAIHLMGCGFCIHHAAGRIVTRVPMNIDANNSTILETLTEILGV